MDSAMLPTDQSVGLLMPALLAIAVLSGCASSRPPSPTASVRAPDAPATEERLRTSVDQWRGTPYDFGGSSKEGIDCSAFVQILYRDVLGVPVPRTTEKQAHAGRPVPADQAQPGDLVFFRPARKQRHVGVYLGDGDFAHASVSQGVMVSELQETYWQDAYWMTRRLLPDAATATEASPEASSSSPQRTGW